MEQGKFKHHKTNVTRVEVSRAADGKDREDRCSQLEKQVGHLTIAPKSVRPNFDVALLCWMLWFLPGQWRTGGASRTVTL